jgi:hypothetical protein
MQKTISYLSLLIVALVMTGCVTGRRTIDLPIPQSAVAYPETREELALKSVEDIRKFENKPKDPSTL